MGHVDRFRWVDGHADMWPVFRDGDAFRALVTALVAPFRWPCGRLLAAAGAELVGCAVVVDQLRPAARASVGRLHALVTADELQCGPDRDDRG